MKLILVFTIVCMVFIPDIAHTLQTCPTIGQCPANSNCKEAGQSCVCNSGFHANSGNTACVQDITPGGVCTVKDAATECVAHATCINVAAAAETASLKCQCDAGYLDKANACEQDVAHTLQTCPAVGQCPANSNCKEAGQLCVCNSGFQANSNNTACVQDVAHTLQTCPTAGQCPANSNCKEAGQLCVCTSGFHANSGNTACVQDLALGATCTSKGSDRECATGATCVNTAAEGQAETLKCACKPEFYEKTQGQTKTCEADITPGGVCTVKDAATECVAHATCINVAAATETASLKCQCDAGYHDKANACELDIEPGAVCTVNDSDKECVTNAKCVNVASAGQPVSLECSCNTGFHNISGTCKADIALGGICTLVDSDTECAGANTVCANVTDDAQGTALKCSCKSGSHLTTGATPTCETDKAPGSTCLIKNSNECVEGAACQNTGAAGQPEVLKCVCKEGFHEKTPAGASAICEVDTCQDTKQKCEAAGKSTCEELTTLVGCMLTGMCDPTDNEEMEVFKGTLDVVRAALPDGCTPTATATCKDKVTACQITFLKGEINCTTVEALGTCLSAAKASCTVPADDKIYRLADTHMTNTNQNLSCVCIKATSACVDAQTKNYESTNADATTKCNAAKELFSCALTSPCDLNKTLDHQTVSGMWSTAMTWTKATGCKSTIAEGSATTCTLQLTRCALVYGDGMKSANNKSSQCRAAETFGSCLNTKTNLCTDNDASMKKLFTDQYSLVSATCTCDNDLNECHDAVGVLTTDPAVACPKLKDFSLCITEAKCDLTKKNSSLFWDQNWYLSQKNSSDCIIESASEACKPDLSVYSDKLIANLSKEGVTADDMCKYTTTFMMRLNATNCSSSNQADLDLTTSLRDAAVHRLQYLPGCKAPTCSVTFESLFGCKQTYEDDFMKAGTDNKKKCIAKNTMVDCLRNHRCNQFLENPIQEKFKALQNVIVSGCDMKSLDDPNGAPTPDKTLSTLLACLAAAYVIIKL